MRLIRTSLVGAKEHPLREAQRFILTCCHCCGIQVEQYPHFSTLSAPEVGGVRPGVEYSVQIAMDEIEIHAYLRRPITGRKPVFEIIFSQNWNETSTTPAA